MMESHRSMWSLIGVQSCNKYYLLFNLHDINWGRRESSCYSVIHPLEVTCTVWKRMHVACTCTLECRHALEVACTVWPHVAWRGQSAYLLYPMLERGAFGLHTRMVQSILRPLQVTPCLSISHLHCWKPALVYLVNTCTDLTRFWPTLIGYASAWS